MEGPPLKKSLIKNQATLKMSYSLARTPTRARLKD